MIHQSKPSGTSPFWRGLLLASVLFAIVSAQSNQTYPAPGQGRYTSLPQAFWQLTNLTLDPHTGRAPSAGGQNFTHCCLIAVNESLAIDNGSVIIRSSPYNYIKTTVNDLFAASAQGQFPCGATWNGDSAGAPIVEVPYSWLEATCPGWQLSDSKKGDESQWISPFVGFLLPAVVFCLTVPRRRKLAVWEKLFVPDMSQVTSWIAAPFAMIVAGIFVVCDTIIWLCICFAFASPMLISGIYEAFLDNRVISFLEVKVKNNHLTLDMRARLLFVILCGNLDLDPEIRPRDSEMIFLGELDKRDYYGNFRWPDYSTRSIPNPSSPWTHIENLLRPLRSFGETEIGQPRQWGMHDVTCSMPYCRNPTCKEIPIRRSPQILREIGRTKTRLRTMLACQYSFGATVGAPVVFFLGAFIFSLVATLSNLGDEDTSLALAFGMWYMIIPHISIVSGLLLAGNNPNTLDGVVALEFSDLEKDETFESKHFGTRLFELAYESRYRPQWLWLRGKSKRDWIEKVWKTYGQRPAIGRPGELEHDGDMVALREATTLTLGNWLLVIGMTLLLMGVPFILAFLTGFYTPQIGVSCRALTFTVYAIAQLCQILLWLWAYGGFISENSSLEFLRPGSFLEKSGFFTPTRVQSFASRKSFFTLPTLWASIWYFSAILYGLGGVVTAIGGTMMQLMGVYNSNKCSINAQWWTKPHGNVPVIISTNYAQEILYARTYWKACAITATIFLAAVTFCGWWYQRRLRALFRKSVADLGNPELDRIDIQEHQVSWTR